MDVKTSDKKKFLSYLLAGHYYLKNPLRTFITELYENNDLLNRVDFSSSSVSSKYKYKVLIHLNSNNFLCQVNVKTYSDDKLLKNILRVLKENKHIELCILITDKDEKIQKLLGEVCMSSKSIQEVISNAMISDSLRDYNIEKVRVLVDESLDNNNKEDFMKYSLLLKELLK